MWSSITVESVLFGLGGFWSCWRATGALVTGVLRFPRIWIGVKFMALARDGLAMADEGGRWKRCV
jgi:hypothetical protein